MNDSRACDQLKTSLERHLYLCCRSFQQSTNNLHILIYMYKHKHTHKHKHIHIKYTVTLEEISNRCSDTIHSHIIIFIQGAYGKNTGQ